MKILVNFTKTLLSKNELFTKYKATNIQQIRGSHHCLTSCFLQMSHPNYFPYNIFLLLKICMLSVNNKTDLEKK